MVKSIVFEAFQRFQVRFVGPVLRAAGKRVYKFGNLLRGPLGSTDRVMPCPNRTEIHSKSPDLQYFSFVAANTSLIGDISSGRDSSIFYASNLKTDGLDSAIVIGSSTIIGDLVTIKAWGGYELRIGDNCFISSNSMLTNCRIGNNVVVGLGATVAEGAEIADGGFLAAGATLESGHKLPAGELWAGSPAKFLRTVNADEADHLTDLRAQHVQLSVIYREEAQRSDRQLFVDREQIEARAVDEDYGENEDGGALENWQDISTRFKFPTSEEDFRNPWNRSSRAQYYMKARFDDTAEPGYDGNKNNLPDYLNVNKPNYHKHNQIAEELANDKDTQRPKDDYFKAPRQTLNDDDFHRKF